MEDLRTSSLTDLTDAIAARRLSPVELMRAVLDRIDETHEKLNAVVDLRDRDAVLAEAEQAEARVARGDGRPLEGIPLGVKDLEDVAGMKTTYGSRLFADNVAARDELHVERLRAAGAIPIAKTNAPEFGPTAITKNLLHGVTRSPWSFEHTPGGSSGGSAAVLSGAVIPLVTASDGGGSIRIPASWTGAFGLKPSQGRVPMGPPPRWDTSMMGVYGPLTKTVEDAALFLDVVVGPTPRDPTALPHPGISYREVVREAPPSGLRIAFSPDLGRAVVQSDVAEAVEEAARVFEKLGHRLEPLSGGPPPSGANWLASSGWGLAGRLADVLPGHEDEIARFLLGMIREADAMTPAMFARIQEERAAVRDWCAGVFERYDLLITPTVPYDPVPAKGPFPLETEGRAQDPAAAGLFTQPFNMCWQPASSVRVGLSRAGFPIGMQIVGGNHRDDLVLQASRQFERERPWHPEWPEV